MYFAFDLQIADPFFDLNALLLDLFDAVAGSGYVVHLLCLGLIGLVVGRYRTARTAGIGPFTLAWFGFLRSRCVLRSAGDQLRFEKRSTTLRVTQWLSRTHVWLKDRRSSNDSNGRSSSRNPGTVLLNLAHSFGQFPFNKGLSSLHS